MIWTFAGTNLEDFGRVTLINEYLDLPDRRGDNQMIPFRHGTRFVEKYYDQRHMLFGIAIQAASAQALEEALDDLRALLSPRIEQTLSNTREDGSVRTAQASVDAPFQLQRFGSNKAKLVIDFTLTSPFFRGSSAIADNTTTIDDSPKEMIVTNPGTVEERDPIITLTGPLDNPEITNTENGVSVKYNAVIAGGANVVIQTAATGEYTAVHSSTGNVIGNVTHEGSAALLVLEPGSNTLEITDGEATTGTVKISFNAPYL